MKLLRHLYRLFPREDRLKLVGLTALMVFGAALEAVGIGLILPFLGAISNPASLARYPLLGDLLDSLGLTGSGELIVALSALLVAFYILKNGFLSLQWWLVFRFMWRGVMKLSRRLLDGYLGAPYTFHLQRNTAELIRNTTEEPKRVFANTLFPLLQVVSEGLVSIGLLSILFMANPLAAAVALAFIGLLGWAFVAGYRRRLNAVGTIRAAEHSRMIQAVNQSLGGLKEIKLRGLGAHFVGVFGGSAKTYTDAMGLSSLMQIFPRMVVETGAVLGMVGFVLALSLTGADMQEVLPLLGLFAVATIRLMPSVNRVVAALNQLNFEAPGVRLVRRELDSIAQWQGDATDGARESGVTFEREIRLEQVSYTYPGAADPALSGLSLRIEKGQSIGIIGSSGAGKTTLINLVLGLLEPTGGRIVVDGADIRDDLRGWQSQLGYIPQSVFLLDGTIEENVAFGVPREEIDRDRVWSSLAAAQLDGFARALPGGLETMCGEDGVRLSGGQRQRIAIARALYYEPRVLVFDEATASLDYETERRVSEAIQELAGERTLIIVTHRIRTVERCDTLYILRDGELADHGRYDELRGRYPILEAGTAPSEAPDYAEERRTV